MGNYLNQDGKKFYEITHSDIYVDKTELLTYTNSVLQTLQKYICISRPRRFGKSITASMILPTTAVAVMQKNSFPHIKFLHI